MPDIWMDVDTAISEAPVNIMPLLDDTDFKTRETAVAFDAAGMDLVWNFVTTGGAYTQTAVTPTSAGNYDWTHQGDGMYSIEIPASGGASINNDTEGFGWFTGLVTGVLPWRGPIIGFRAAALNNSLVDGSTIDVNVTAMAAGTVTASAIATGAIDADAIADNAIDAGAIASDAITAAKIATGAITAAKFAAGAIDAAAIATDAIGAAEIADGAITAATFAAGAIDAAAIATGAVDADALAADAVAEIADGVWDETLSGHTTLATFGQVLNALGLRTGEVNDAGASTTVFIVDGFTEATNDHFNGMVIAFTSGACLGQVRTIIDYTGATQTITLGEPLTDAPANNDDFVIVPGQFGGGDLAKVIRLFITILDQSTGQVDNGSFAAGAIDANAIATDAIGAAELADGAITAATFAAGAIDAAAIANGAIDAATFAAGAIDAAAIADGAIDAGAIAADAITAAKIATGAIDADALAADAVTEIWAKAMSDLAAVPAINASVLDAINWMFALSRNKLTQTSTTQTAFKDDGSTQLAASTHSDDGTTHTRGEFA